MWGEDMLKCKICGTEFPSIKEQHYVGIIDASGFALAPILEKGKEERKVYDCFDCPMCGCQVVAQERKRKDIS